MARVVIYEQNVKTAAQLGLRPILQAKLMQALSAAQANAPRDTGAYANSFSISLGLWAGWVSSSDPGARAIEFGARRGANPRFRVLGRATDAMVSGG